MDKKGLIGFLIGLAIVFGIWGIVVARDKEGGLHFKVLIIGVVLLFVALLAYTFAKPLINMFNDKGNEDQDEYNANIDGSVTAISQYINKNNLSHRGWTGNEAQDLAAYSIKSEELFQALNGSDNDMLLSALKNVFYTWCTTPDDLRLINQRYGARSLTGHYAWYNVGAWFSNNVSDKMTLRQTIEYAFQNYAIYKIDRDALIAKLDWAGVP